MDDEDDKDYRVEEEVQAMEVGLSDRSPRRRSRGGKGARRKKKDTEPEVELEVEDPTVGDIFALEMELNRENKKMMKVRRRRRRRRRNNEVPVSV